MVSLKNVCTKHSSDIENVPGNVMKALASIHIQWSRSGIEAFVKVDFPKNLYIRELFLCTREAGNDSTSLKNINKLIINYLELRARNFTMTALEEAVTHVHEALKKKEKIMGLFFDMTRTFDTVSHD